MLLLRGDEVRNHGGQRVGPPVPRGHEQQNGNQHRVRRKNSDTLLSGKVSAQAVRVAR